ncbi:hypothetical protein ACEW7V_01800 [Areca yellow leaf disease phytoplasma]|uniref:hypothetical protein n=1 Tax=Areca yellow leaf disease phytoplasma TaxID=927614 RepID=UPI0035B52773
MDDTLLWKLNTKTKVSIKEFLITTLTINMSEDLTAYLKKLCIKVAYLHSEIKSYKDLKF